jgi:hypothetical protein
LWPFESRDVRRNLCAWAHLVFSCFVARAVHRNVACGVAAKDCRLRIHTSKGYQGIKLSTEYIPGGKATAIVTIKEFMAKVAAARGNG